MKPLTLKSTLVTCVACLLLAGCNQKGGEKPQEEKPDTVAAPPAPKLPKTLTEHVTGTYKSEPKAGEKPGAFDLQVVQTGDSVVHYSIAPSGLMGDLVLTGEKDYYLWHNPHKNYYVLDCGIKIIFEAEQAWVMDENEGNRCMDGVAGKYKKVSGSTPAF